MAALTSRVSAAVAACGRQKQLVDRPDQLDRCLGRWSIVCVGVGTTVGSGIYVLSGEMLSAVAGPSLVLSYLMAGVVSAMSAMCFAEFGARVPQAGSAYAYIYSTVGELLGFLIGMDLILENVISVSAVALSTSHYIQLMFHSANGTQPAQLQPDTFQWQSHLLALLLVSAVNLLVITGIRLSTTFIGLFVLLNASLATLIIGAGFSLADFQLWTPFYSAGSGFMPFGLSGTLSGASLAFFSYSGFDTMGQLAEEAKNPVGDLPVAVLSTCAIVTVAYTLMATALSLMVPYDQLNPTNAFADAFRYHDVLWAELVVSAAGSISMCCSMLCAALSVCIRPVLVAWIVECFLLVALDLEELVEMLSVGVLMAYSLVALAVILLRYRQPEHQVTTAKPVIDDEEQLSRNDSIPVVVGSTKAWLRWLYAPSADWPLDKTAHCLLAGCLVDWAAICAIIRCHSYLFDWLFVVLLVVCAFVLFIFSALLAGLRTTPQSADFLVPLQPWLPLGAIYCNMLFFVYLNPLSWLRALAWLIIAVCIYTFYSVPNVNRSTEPNKQKDYQALD